MKPITYIHAPQANTETIEEWSFGISRLIGKKAYCQRNPTIAIFEYAAKEQEVLLVVDFLWEEDAELFADQLEIIDSMISHGKHLIIISEQPILEEYLEYATCLKYYTPRTFTK